MYRNNYGVLKAGLILTIVLQVLALVAVFAVGVMLSKATSNGPFGYLMEKIEDDKFEGYYDGFLRGREIIESISGKFIAIPWIIGGIMAVALAITSAAFHNVKKASLTGRPISRGLSIFAGILALGTTFIGGILILIGAFSSPQPSPYDRDIPRPRRDFDRDYYDRRRRRDRWEDDRDLYERRRSRRRYREDDYDDDYRRPYR